MPSGVPGAPSDLRLTLKDAPTRYIVSSRNLWDFYSEQGVEVRLMDVFLKFMTADTIIFGVRASTIWSTRTSWCRGSLDSCYSPRRVGIVGISLFPWDASIKAVPIVDPLFIRPINQLEGCLHPGPLRL